MSGMHTQQVGADNRYLPLLYLFVCDKLQGSVL
jgi:hypothetical protein